MPGNTSPVPIRQEQSAAMLETVLLEGDLSKLSPSDRLVYYRQVCESLGLNPLTKPFAYLKLNGKLVLYALKDCTEQLRKLHNVSITGLDYRYADDLVMVTAMARDARGRIDSDMGAVPLAAAIKGEVRATALKKATTQAKRRVTLSICGLGMLDETEVETIPGAERIPIEEGRQTLITHDTPQLPAADPAELAQLRQEVRDYEHSDLPGIKAIEKKYGSIDNLSLETTEKALVWLAVREEERQRQDVLEMAREGTETPTAPPHPTDVDLRIAELNGFVDMAQEWMAEARKHKGPMKSVDAEKWRALYTQGQFLTQVDSPIVADVAITELANWTNTFIKAALTELTELLPDEGGAEEDEGEPL